MSCVHPNHPETFRRLVQIFEELELRFRVEPDACVLHTGFQGRRHGLRYQIWLWIEPDDNSPLRIRCDYPVNVPASLRRTVAEMVCRASYGLRDGHYFLDMRDGEVGFTCSVRIVNHDLPTELVSDLLRMTATMMEGYWPAFEACIFHGMEPEEAVVRFDPLRCAEIGPSPQGSADQ
ncbi:MAG: YbjN domain-containing protein [Candidatus Sumerlaeia bacterium]|nr:YbjN domain-containing protein [Candidatus Sumerlaeia bacterium]